MLCTYKGPGMLESEDFEVPDIWIAGFMQASEAQGMGLSIGDAICHWAYQVRLERGDFE